MADDQNNGKKGPVIGLLAILLATPMVAKFEGLVTHTYQDPLNIPTACYGETNKDVVLVKHFSEQECTALLGASLMEHAQHVSQCINKPIKQNEAAAILSWSYNVGADAACTSTLLRLINQGAPAAKWCPELKRWVYGGGVQLPGLVTRREAEYRMCMEGKWQ